MTDEGRSLLTDSGDYEDLNERSLGKLVASIRSSYPGLFWGFAAFVLFLIGAVVALGVLYGAAVRSDTGAALPPIEPPPPGAGNALSAAYDFPVWSGVQAWDVAANHSALLRADVSTVTWSSVTISPNGTSMVFDVLGDLYQLALDPASLLPPPGAAATLLLGGVEWARDPRFSPDGGSVAFTYDKSGVDNVWTLELASGALTQLTHETYRWVSAPCYTPDGAQLVANKWLYSTRSLGAGELWLYSAQQSTPLNGGRLLLGIATPDSQLGPEEPVVSRDGDYVYYSFNGNTQTFDYSSNVHGALYQIYRRHLRTNATTLVAGGYGGAARPVLSRDGRSLAYVKRTEFNTSLVLLDLASGNQRLLYAGLDIDMQDSYSPTGNYPSFDFSPAGDYIVVWAAGRFLRIDVASAAATPLDFAPLSLSLALSPAVRHPVSVDDGAAFDTKVTAYTPSLLVQSATADTTAVYFTSVGGSYLAHYAAEATAPLAPPVRLTQQPDVVEMAPCVASSGLFVVQATWNDRRLGALQRVDVASGAVSALTEQPARYSNPRLSPDDQLLAYTVSAPSSLTGIAWPLPAAGVYVMALASGQALWLRGGGTPQWLNATHLGVATGSRLFAVPVSLHSDSGAVAVGAETVVATGKYATELRLSPDGGYVAFVEFGWVYVAKKTSLEVSSRPGHMPASGVLLCSPDGGTNIQWLPHGNVLAWLLGATLYTVDMAAVQHCWTNGAAAQNSWTSPPTADCVLAHTVARSLSTRQPTAVPAPDRLLCLTNASLAAMLDRADERLIARGELHIRGETIVAVVDLDAAAYNDTCAALPDATVIDLAGSVVLPGFIDAHAHWSFDASITVQNSWEQLINLAFGVTTMFNPSANTQQVMADAELARAGIRLGPRITSTGTIIYGAGGALHQEIDSLDTALAVLRRHQAYGCPAVKSYNQPQRYARQMILAAAQQLQMNVVPEGGMMPAWDLTMLVDGHTTIEHNIPVILKEDAIKLWNASGTASTPTLLVCYGDLWGEIYAYQHENVWEDPRVEMYTPQLAVQARSMRRLSAADADYYHFRVSQNIKELADAGVNVEIGAHGQQQGIGYTWELMFFQQGGQTPYQVMFAATHGAARALGLQKVGQLLPGYLADLVVYPKDASPLLDVSFARSLTHVVRGGRVFESPSLVQIYPDTLPSPVFPQQNLATGPI